MRKGILRYLGLLLMAAGILLAASCSDGGAAAYFVNGTIDGTAYNKSGYTQANAVGGATLLLAADSLADMPSNGVWQINFFGTTVGTYSFPDALVVYYASPAGLDYGSGDDLVLVVTEYTSDLVAGTFSGDFTYSDDGSEHPVTGEFRMQF